MAVPQTPEHLQECLRQHAIPPHMWPGVERYLFHNIPPGSFMKAVLTNDLKRASYKADDENRMALAHWVTFVNACLPPEAHGSEEIVHDWISRAARQATSVCQFRAFRPARP